MNSSSDRSRTSRPDSASSACSMAWRARSTPERSSSPRNATVERSPSVETMTENGCQAGEPTGKNLNENWGLALAGGAGGGLECATRLGRSRVRDDPAEPVLVDQRDPVVALDHVMAGQRSLAPKPVDQHHVVADLEPILRLHARLVEVAVERLEVELHVVVADVALRVGVAVAGVPLDLRVAEVDTSCDVAVVESLDEPQTDGHE